MRLLRIVARVAVFGFALSSTPQEQASEQPLAATSGVYEVVSIKPNKPGSPVGVATLPNGFYFKGIPLGTVFRNAFGIFNDKQIIGLPEWTYTDPYDVEAKVDEDRAARWQKLTDAERRKEELPMMQAMLIDRCKLKFHYETKELPVYDLVIAKSGLRMKEAPQNEVETSEMTGGDGVTLTAHAMSVEKLTITLSGTDDRLVVDKTGLGAKRFDFTLHWSFNPGLGDGLGAGPALFAALPEQLGLKLVPSKEPVNVLVVDQMVKPSPN